MEVVSVSVGNKLKFIDTNTEPVLAGRPAVGHIIPKPNTGLADMRHICYQDAVFRPGAGVSIRSGKHELCVDIQQHRVEIPFAINAYVNRAAYEAEAFIALGCIIKGDTPHFEYVCQSVTQGVTILNTQLDAPVIFGVLTVNTEEQAKERIGGIHGHKGEEAAMTALKMIALCRALDVSGEEEEETETEF